MTDPLTAGFRVTRGGVVGLVDRRNVHVDTCNVLLGAGDT